MERPSILIVEDDEHQLKSLISLARKHKYRCKGVATCDEALVILGSERFDYLVTDIHLSDELTSSLPDGLKLLREVKFNHPDLKTIAISSDPNTDMFTKALSYGAKQYIRKPIEGWDDVGIAISLVDRQAKFEGYYRQTHRGSSYKLPSHLSAQFPDGIVTSKKIRRQISTLAKMTNVTLHLKGETGTGKEEIAKLLHRERELESGKDIPFLPVNCAHLEGTLAQAKLFGHVKGAFTGADQASNGFVGEANGGILFLDEVHHLNFDAQKMLLRVLNDGSYTRVGETRELKSDFQLVIATTQDLDDLVDDGKLLEDIRARLYGYEITLPPLRHRKEDILPIIEIFFSKEGITLSQSVLKEIAKKCERYYWQGNIRTLLSAMKNIVTDAAVAEIDISADLLVERRSMLPPKSEDAVRLANDLKDKNLPSLETSTITNLILSGDYDLGSATKRFEKSIISDVLKQASSIGEAASLLGIARGTLDMKRKKYGIF